MATVNRSKNIVCHTWQGRFRTVAFPTCRLHSWHRIVSFYVVVRLYCDNLFDHFAKERNINNRSVVLKNLLVEVNLFQMWAYV